MEYSKETIKVTLKTMPGWFFFFRPLRVPYDKLAQEKGGPMWEKSASFGRGWIGIEHPEGDTKIAGEFNTYVHKGSYKGLGKTFQQIMQDHSSAREFYTIYVNSPKEVSEAELETKIVFR